MLHLSDKLAAPPPYRHTDKQKRVKIYFSLGSHLGRGIKKEEEKTKNQKKTTYIMTYNNNNMGFYKKR